MAFLKNLGALSALIVAFVTAVLALLVAFGADLSQPQQAAILGVLGALIALVAGIVAKVTTPNGNVVEKTPDGRAVIAGPANELPTGTLVRENLGYMPDTLNAPAARPAPESITGGRPTLPADYLTIHTKENA